MRIEQCLSCQLAHEINLRLVTHVAHNFYIGVRSIGSVYQGSATVEVISPKAIHDGLERLKGSLVENKVPRKDVHCST